MICTAKALKRTSQIGKKVAAASPNNKELRETVGEQKVILENIILLLSFYKESDQNMASLLTDLKTLKQEYDKVKITYEYKEPTSEVVDGVLMIKDNSTSTIVITAENIESIKKLTSEIRNKIIS